MTSISLETITLLIAPNLNYSGGALPTTVIRYDAFAHYDCVIVFDNGRC